MLASMNMDVALIVNGKFANLVFNAGPTGHPGSLTFAKGTT